MPLYFFDLHNGFGHTRDEEGRELASLDQARAEAIRQVRPIMAEEVMSGRLDLTGRIAVRGAAGEALFDVPFSEALSLTLPRERSSGPAP